MLHLIPAPLHRQLYRLAYRARGHLRRLTGRPTAGVAVLARDDAGRVLLVRHSYGSGRWALPGGGRGRAEDPEHCARREVREELGCELADIELVEVAEGRMQGAPNTSHIFTARLVGEPRPDGRELIEARWFALDDLPEEMVRLSRFQIDRLERR